MEKMGEMRTGDAAVRCRYTREECEEPALYKVGCCDLCDVAERRTEAGRQRTVRTDRTDRTDQKTTGLMPGH